MAGPGYTFVDGINEIVETVGEFPMSGGTKPSASGDTASIYYLAEKHIDRHNKRVQAQGWPENTVYSRAYTPTSVNAVDNVVVLAETVLRIQAASTSEGRPLVIRVDTADADTPKVFDSILNSFNLGSTDTVYLDQVELLAFEDLTPGLQDVILTQAKASFQRMFQGNLNLDTVLSGEEMRANMSADRNTFENRRAFNDSAPKPPSSSRSSQQ